MHKEDGHIFLRDFLDSGWASVGEIYSGYLHVFPRLIAGLCASLPAETFPTCVLISMAGLRVWFFILAAAVFIAWFPARWKWAVAAAATFLFFGAGQQEVWGNITNLRWFGVAIAGIALAADFKKPGWSIAAGLTAGLAVLADPIAIGFLPVAIWRVFAVRGWARVMPAIFLVAAATQLAVIRPADRGIAGDSLLDDPVGALTQGIVRGITSSQFGVFGTSGIMLVGGALLAVLAAALPVSLWLLLARRRRLRDTGVPVILYLIVYGILTLGATFYFADLSSIPLADWWAPQDASRYSALAALFFTPALLLTAGVILGDAQRWERWLVWTSLAALSLSVVLDFRGDPWNTAGPEWPSTVGSVREQCAAGAEAVLAPITPSGVQIEWEVMVPCEWVD